MNSTTSTSTSGPITSISNNSSNGSSSGSNVSSASLTLSTTTLSTITNISNSTDGDSDSSHSDSPGVLAAQMQIFMWSAAIIWLICALALYKQQVKWKRRRRSDDVFHQLESTRDDREAQYLVSFFTGRGYRHAPSGNVRLHLIGSIYPGKFHTLRATEPERPEEESESESSEKDTDEDEEDDDVDLAGGESGGVGGALNQSKSRRTIKSDLPRITKPTFNSKPNPNPYSEREREHRRGSTPSHHHKYLFPPNSHEKFLITEDVNLGRISMVVLQTEVEGKHPYWDCETVIVRCVATNEAWYFKAHARIGFPPVILDPATVEELTTFKLSWQRRVRREVRHGQYVYFGFFFRPHTSNYSFAQRIVLAVVCYLILFVNSVLLLGLAFPPESLASHGGSHHNHSHFIRSRDLRHWTSHVAATGVLAALCTSVAGYIFVRLFTDKYAIGVHEMDYVIGTALQEYNEKKSAVTALSAKTGHAGHGGKGGMKEPAQDADVERQSPEMQTQKKGTSIPELKITLVSEEEAKAKESGAPDAKKPDDDDTKSKLSELPQRQSSASTSAIEQLTSLFRRGSFQGLQMKEKETAPAKTQSKIEDIARKMRLPFPKPSKSNPPTPKRSPVSTLESELSPEDKREMMRSLFEQDNEPFVVAAPEVNQQKASPATAAARSPCRLFPHPAAAYFALTVLFLIPVVTLFIWLTPVASNLTSTGISLTIQMILSTYCAALLLEVLGMELLKMGLLGVYYALTDKRLYKKVVKSSVKKGPPGKKIH